MKLYIKEGVFSLTERFPVMDEMGNERYTVEGEFHSWGFKIHIYDENNAEVSYLKQKILAFLPRFEIFVGGRMVTEVVKESGKAKQSYTFSQLNWNVVGDYFAHDYAILNRETCLARIQKTWIAWGNCYEIHIAPDLDEVLALAAVLSIDSVTASNR